MDRVGKLMENPGRGLLTLAWPMVVSMLFSTLLHLADFIFVGGLGPEALAAVQLAFPIFFLVVAISSGVNIGTTSLIARRLGEKNKKWAEESALHGILLAVTLAVAVTALALFVEPIAYSLGGSPEVSALASQYLGVFFSGVIVFFLVFTLQAILQGEGDTKTPMKFSITYVVINIILDPIFIYYFNLGVGGAALATVLSAGIALMLAIWYIIIAKKSYLQINPREFIYTPQIIKNILKVGLPAGTAQITLSIMVLGINLILSSFGDLAISAYGIGFRIDSMAILPMLGLASGVIPMVGYFRGSGDYVGARRVSRLALKISLIFGVVIGTLIFLLSGIFPHLFIDDPVVTSMATNYLRIVAFAYPFIGAFIVLSASFQGMGRGMPSLVITLSRSLLVVLPLSFFLAFYTELGVTGVWVGILISTMITAGFAFGWIEVYFKRLCGACGKRKEEPASAGV
jgi:putative MATE family efflux protein